MGKSKNMKVTGKFIVFDQKNKNGRIYTKECGSAIMQQFNKLAHEGQMILGEFGYPENRFEVSLGNVSHRVDSLEFDMLNNCLRGTIEILETPKGKQILKMLNENGYKFEDLFVVRPRGTGTVNEKGEVENYTLYSFDVIFKQEDAFNQNVVKI